MKICRDCGVSYEPTPRRKTARCDACYKAYLVEWRKRANKDPLYRDKRTKARKDAKYVAAQKEWANGYYARNRCDPDFMEKRAAYQRRYRAMPEHQDRFKARRAVNKALCSGLLQRQPCEVCGATKTEAHHDDYAKPLEVRWLCRKHHDEHHALHQPKVRNILKRQAGAMHLETDRLTRNPGSAAPTNLKEQNMSKSWFVIDEQNGTSWADSDAEQGERFNSKTAALKRAKALAESAPGETFLVCEAVEAVRCPVGNPIIAKV